MALKAGGVLAGDKIKIEIGLSVIERAAMTVDAPASLSNESYKGVRA